MFTKLIRLMQFDKNSHNKQRTVYRRTLPGRSKLPIEFSQILFHQDILL